MALAVPSGPSLRLSDLMHHSESFPVGLNPFRGLVLASVALLLSACRAPGMKMDIRAMDHPITYQVNGEKVTLRPLDGASVREFGTPMASSLAGLQDLISGKVEPYKIGCQDVLLVTVWDHPELTLPLGQFRTDASTGMVVDEDGFLYYPYIGRVKVAGLSVVQVRELLTARLDKVLQKPQVDLKVLAFRSQKIFVGGEVRSPAVYNVTDISFTLAEAINRAGGFLPTADQSRVVVSRGDRAWTLNFLELLAQGNRIGQILLQDGDSVHVHHRDEAPVYLLGEVRNPRSVPTYQGRLSLAQALSEAGGINTASAAARSVYVFRRGQTDNTVDVFHLDAYNPIAMVLADRFALQARDVVFVDAGTLVRWNRVLSLILPSTSILTSLPSTINDSKTAFK